MDQRVKSLIEELCVAINESVSESEHAAEVIGELKSDGYDVECALSAMIMLRRRESETGPPGQHGGSLRSKLSAEDMEFLKSLRIKLR